MIIDKILLKIHDILINSPNSLLEDNIDNGISHISFIDSILRFKYQNAKYCYQIDYNTNRFIITTICSPSDTGWYRIVTESEKVKSNVILFQLHRSLYKSCQ